jgi:hypothetical protein
MIHNHPAYDDAYATARSCLLSLALISGPTTAWHYRSILMHLDAIHGWPVGDHTLPGHQWELLARP